MNGRIQILGAALAVVCLVPWEVANAEEAQMDQVVESGSVVKIEYTLTVDGEVVDASKGEPLQYVHGQGQIIPGLEEELVGMHVGESKEVTVAPEKAYGQVDPNGYVEIPKDRLAQGIDPKPGMVLSTQGQDGKALRVRVHEVRDDIVVVDINHPLAGKTLNFKVEVVDISAGS